MTDENEIETVTGEVVKEVTVADHEWHPRTPNIHLRTLDPGKYKLVRVDDE